MKKELIAKVKFWFGVEHPIFNTKDYIIEQSGADENFVYIYKEVKE